MRSEVLRRTSGLEPVLLIQSPQKAHHSRSGITGLGKDHQPQCIGFTLIFTVVTQLIRKRRATGCRHRRCTGLAAQQDRRDDTRCRWQLALARAIHHPRQMALRYMGQLMSHDGSQFSLISRCQNQSGKNSEPPAGASESIDKLVINQEKPQAVDIAFKVSGQSLTQALYVFQQ